MSDDKSREDLYKKLSEAEKQIENREKLLDAQDVFKDLKNKYIDDKEVEEVAKKILDKHKAAFDELGK